jgi:hypothetical protein
MKEQFVSYQIAKKLKELGFNEPCLGEWQNLKTGVNLVIDEEDRIFDVAVLGAEIKAPLRQQALDWLRDKHKIHVEVERDLDGWCYKITEFSSGNKFKCSGRLEMPNHNVEVDKAIIKAFELIKV